MVHPNGFVLFFKWAIPVLFFFILVFSTVNSKHVHYKISPMTALSIWNSLHPNLLHLCISCTKTSWQVGKASLNMRLCRDCLHQTLNTRYNSVTRCSSKKSRQNFSKSCQKLSQQFFLNNGCFSKKPKTVLNIWATFVNKFFGKNFKKLPIPVTLLGRKVGRQVHSKYYPPSKNRKINAECKCWKRNRAVQSGLANEVLKMKRC